MTYTSRSGRGQLDAQSAGDLVAHARVAVLDVVALRVPRAPELVQVARHRAGGADDDVRRSRRVVDGADHLALSGQRLVTQPIQARRPPRPTPCSSARSPLAVLRLDLVALRAQPPSARSVARASATSASAVVLGGVEVGDVDVDEAHVRIAERRLRRGREVATSACRCRSRGRPRAAMRLAANVPVTPTAPSDSGMVVRKRALAGLRLARPECRSASTKRAQRVGRLGVDDAAAGDDQRALRAADQRDRLGRATPRPGTGRGTCQTRCARNSSGKSYASACTSCGNASVTAPVSAWFDEHAHRRQRRGHELLGPLDPVEVARHRPQRVVDRDVAARGRLELLQHRVRRAAMRRCRRAAAAPAGG